MAEEREKKRKKSHANGGPEPAPARGTQEMKAGELLRHVREEKGMELEEVSSAIHVRVVQLRAIEEGHIESLPGMTYAMGFVKSYASFLKLDPASVANKFKAEHSVAPAKPDLKFPEPMSEHKMPDIFMIGAAVAGIVLLLGVWFFFSGGEEKTMTNVATAIPAPPSDIAPLTASPSAPAETAGATPASAVPATPAASTASTAPATAAAVPVAAAPGAKPVVTEATAPAKPTKPATPAAPGLKPAATAKPATTATAKPAMTIAGEARKPASPAEPAASEQKQETINIRPRNGRVMVVATQSAWVQVTDPAGNVLLKQVLHPGDRYVVPDEKGLRLLTSNAGGIRLFVDGQQSGRIGQSGEIVRGVSLNPEAVNRPSPSSSSSSSGHRSAVHD